MLANVVSVTGQDLAPQGTLSGLKCDQAEQFDTQNSQENVHKKILRYSNSRCRALLKSL